MVVLSGISDVPGTLDVGSKPTRVANKSQNSSRQSNTAGTSHTSGLSEPQDIVELGGSDTVTPGSEAFSDEVEGDAEVPFGNPNNTRADGGVIGGEEGTNEGFAGLLTESNPPGVLGAEEDPLGAESDNSGNPFDPLGEDEEEAEELAYGLDPTPFVDLEKRELEPLADEEDEDEDLLFGLSKDPYQVEEDEDESTQEQDEQAPILSVQLGFGPPQDASQVGQEDTDAAGSDGSTLSFGLGTTSEEAESTEDGLVADTSAAAEPGEVQAPQIGLNEGTKVRVTGPPEQFVRVTAGGTASVASEDPQPYRVAAPTPGPFGSSGRVAKLISAYLNPTSETESGSLVSTEG